ncbi:DUF2269 domain-containing protein [Streptomyces sp. TM32]|uniref:DUF2269 domain-containing protein n=1 Tax=Streptomyces sp. TM32 TaxID=1652669 RepID=UPI0010104E0B|nr:DUF2269 domain-containing protein [Streptomyces sp. TM32]RXS87686.1 DUF2269 domain-containing protein [Streptomyces sp. TM32]
MQQLSRPARRAVLVLHVAVSVSWLGLTLGLLALGLTGYTTGSPAMATAAYRAMKVFGDWLVLPIALMSLLSGLVLSLGTPWGLARHRWVVIKFWLTLLTLLLSVFALRPGINRLAAAAAAGTPAPDIHLVIAPAVATATYFFLTAISVLKPWGPTKRGSRLRAARSVRDRAGRARTSDPAGVGVRRQRTSTSRGR